jgi:hypothetical protein
MKQRTKIREFQYTAKEAQKTQLTCSVSIGGEGTTASAFFMQQSTEGMFAVLVMFKSNSAVKEWSSSSGCLRKLILFWIDAPPQNGRLV